MNISERKAGGCELDAFHRQLAAHVVHRLPFGRNAVLNGDELVTALMRGSLSYVSLRVAGTGISASHFLTKRNCSSWASTSCRIVVPERGRPTMNTGCVITSSAISGCRLYQSVTWSRFCR